MQRRAAVITLTSDFGTADTFVGSMKGIILGINAAAVIVDITHAIPRHDIAAASFHLANAWCHFPLGTIHVAVVDPGVGSDRRALAVSASGQMFVAPDNGLLSPWLQQTDARVHEITDSRYTSPNPSRTFHGRDIFAPTAAHLSRGVAIEEVGAIVSDPVHLNWPRARIAGTTIDAVVLHVDGFGNLILNVGPADLEQLAREAASSRLRTTIGGITVDRFVTHYAAAEGAPCFLVNSDDRLEVALPGGSAADLVGLSRGDSLRIEAF